MTHSAYLGVPVREAGWSILAHLHEDHGWAIAIVPGESGLEVTAHRGSQRRKVTGQSILEIAPWLAHLCGCR